MFIFVGMKKYTYRYNVISKRTGEEEPFTGTFDTKKEATQWYDKYAHLWEDKGYVLIFRRNEVR